VRDGVWIVAHLDACKRGSFEQQMIALAEALATAGVPLTCVFCSMPPAYPGDELRRLGVRLRALDVARPIEAARQLLAWLSAEPAALVHLHFIRAYSPVAAAAYLSGARVLVHEHIALKRGDLLRERVKGARSRALNFLAHRRAAVSEFVARTLEEVDRVPTNQTAVVENGIDVARFSGASGARVRGQLGIGRQPLIACVSRLDEEKGVESAVRALVYTRSAHLAIAGSGPLRTRLAAIAARQRTAGRLHLLGLRDDVEQVLAAADVVVVPSHWDEAFGLATVEGMAAGKPLVVTRSGAMPDIVGPAGLVVPKRDPAALGLAAQRLIDDPGLARELGRRGRQRSTARYGMTAWVSRILGLYGEMCPLLGGFRSAA
jgi:glycosyltransferase involved in cell wall biosynthesis